MNSSLIEQNWDSTISNHHGHLLQSWAWGQLKSGFGWTPVRAQTEYAAAQMLFRRLPLGFSIGYIPKGPLIDWKDADQVRHLLDLIHAEAKKHRAVFLKIEPDLWETEVGDESSSEVFGPVAAFLSECGFTPADAIQPQTSIVIDISGSDDDIMAAMKQKTRYNIRLARKKDVVVRQGSEADAPLFYQLAQLTAQRDSFGIHSLDYYQMAMRLFGPGRCALLIAEFEGEPLAALMVFRHEQSAYYFYGASSNAHRNLMPTYLLQWEAIRWAKTRGCIHYDLWGVPNATAAELEAGFTERSDGLWGVYRFKRGFGGEIVQSIGAFDYVYNPLLYRVYRWRRGV